MKIQKASDNHKVKKNKKQQVLCQKGDIRQSIRERTVCSAADRDLCAFLHLETTANANSKNISLPARGMTPVPTPTAAMGSPLEKSKAGSLNENLSFFLISSYQKLIPPAQGIIELIGSCYVFLSCKSSLSFSRAGSSKRPVFRFY